ncbi:MAG: 2,4'-dihydroxyacetophenone dioxygenase family protein [Algiphilus sp.]|uniref:2,4'-dihydroxyacetophenone dioxygenase family protein n=1 Tax=Algiphilus sp. TaxID=1872431 RepID=UPI0032EE578C
MSIPKPINRQDRLLCLHTSDVEPVDIGAVLPGVKAWPLFLDSENGVWVIKAEFAPGTQVPMHFHTGTVHFYQLSGEWYYLEHVEDVQKPGSYLYEPGGSVHTFAVPADAKEPAVGFMVVQGANINFDENGEFINVMDAGWIEQVINECAKAAGQSPRYIKPKAKAGFTDA